MRRIFLVVCCVVFCAKAAAIAEPHVIIITIDGFAAYNMKDKNAPIPTLRKLAEEGAVAEGMKVCNPSVTWPNHTTLISGVRPDKHGVLFNGILMRPGVGMPVAVDSKRDGSELVGVQTVPDILHKAGMRCGEINWPCTRNSPSYEDSFSDVPEQVKWMTPKLREELVALKELPDATDKTWGPLSAARKDQVWAAAACQVIKARKPNLLLLHLLVTDGLQHKYGPQTPGAMAAIAMADSHIRDVLRALDEEGIEEIIEPDRDGDFHYPTPEKNPQMAEMVLAAKPDYAFSNKATGEDFVIAPTLNQDNFGHHGYLNSYAKMNAVFIAVGRGIAKGTKLGMVENVDVAPTAGFLLGQEIPGADGKVMKEILSEGK